MLKDTPVFFGNRNKLFKKYIDDYSGCSGMHDCRIPSILALKNGEFAGTVVAAADKAAFGTDWGRIELGVRLSHDGGKTFEPLKTIFSPPVRKYTYKDTDISAAFCIDPIMTEAPTGKIVLLIDFYPECKGLHERRYLEKGSGYVNINGKNYLALHTGLSPLNKRKDRKDEIYTLREDGFVYDPLGKKTRYYVPKRHNPAYAFSTMGDMYYARKNGEYVTKFPPLVPVDDGVGDVYVGNIFLSDGKKRFEDGEPVFVQKWEMLDDDGQTLCVETLPAPFCCSLTSFIYRLESYDGGKTFTQPYDITPTIKDESDGEFLGVTPGVGNVLKFEKQKDRFVVPVYSLDRAGVIISEDNGKTWRRGKNPDCKNIDECQLIEAPNGKIYCLGRPKGGGKIPLSISSDGGETFEKCSPVDVYAPQCQRSVAMLPDSFVLPDRLKNDGYYMVLVTPTGHNGRDNTRTDGKLYLGHIEDNKIKFVKSYYLKDSSKYGDFAENSDFFAYSSCCILSDDTIGVLYEAYPSGYITFCELKLS